MQRPHTQALFLSGIDHRRPSHSLAQVLASALELVALPDNDFSWSSWADAAAATAEIQALMASVSSGVMPEQLKVSVLFAVTGPLQELSLSSGWAQVFVRLAALFDDVEALIWQS